MKTKPKSTRKFDGQKLRDMRIDNGKTLEELGVLVGLDHSSISQFETGGRRPNVRSLKKLSDYFKMPIADFFVA